MKLHIFTFVAVAALTFGACENPAQPVQPAQPSAADPASPAVAQMPNPEWVVVDNHGVIMVFGKETSLENLQEVLMDSLVNMAVVPDEISIKFGDEILMGMRGEVRTEAAEAIAAAKRRKDEH